jgi:hypothetical protein
MPLPRAPMPPAPLPDHASRVVTTSWPRRNQAPQAPRLRHDAALAPLFPMCTLPRPALACSILSTLVLGHGHHAGCTKPTMNPSRAIKRPCLAHFPHFASPPLHPTSPTSQMTPRRPRFAAARRQDHHRRGHRMGGGHGHGRSRRSRLSLSTPSFSPSSPSPNAPFFAAQVHRELSPTSPDRRLLQANAAGRSSWGGGERLWTRPPFPPRTLRRCVRGRGRG